MQAKPRGQGLIWSISQAHGLASRGLARLFGDRVTGSGQSTSLRDLFNEVLSFGYTVKYQDSLKFNVVYQVWVKLRVCSMSLFHIATRGERVNLGKRVTSSKEGLRDYFLSGEVFKKSLQNELSV